MRQLTAGDLSAKLARIEESGRSSKWRRRARRHLLADAGAELEGKKSKPTGYRLEGGGFLCVKRRYPTELAALKVLVSVNRSPSLQRNENRYYLCPHCNGWHLTSIANGEPDHDRIKEDWKHRQEIRRVRRQAYRYDFGARSFIHRLKGIQRCLENADRCTH